MKTIHLYWCWREANADKRTIESLVPKKKHSYAACSGNKEVPLDQLTTSVADTTCNYCRSIAMAHMKDAA